MTDELEQLLEALRLRRVADILDGELASADKEERSRQDFLARLWGARAQMGARMPAGSGTERLRTWCVICPMKRDVRSDQ